MFRVWVPGLQAVLAAEGMEDSGEVCAEIDGICEQIGDRVRVCFAVLEELLCCLLNGLETASIVVKFGVGGL